MHKDPKDLRIISWVAYIILLAPLAIVLLVMPFLAYGYLFPAKWPDTVIHIDPFIPEWHCRDFEVGDVVDQFDLCFDYFLTEGELFPQTYPPKKMYQPYIIKKLPTSISSGNESWNL